SYGMNLKVDGYYLKDYFILICKFNFEQEIFRFSEMLDNATGIYFWVKDINGNYITVNQKWLDEVGLPNKAGIEGLNSGDIWPKKQCEKFRANEKEVIRDNTIKIFEETLPLRNGYKTVDTTIWPLLDDNQNPIGTMGMAIDGKSRASFYENLKENERNFKEITKYCESVFFIRDEEKLLYISPSYETLFEESSEPLEDDVYKFNDCFKNEKHKQGILENFEFDKLNEGRAKAKLKNGKEKWIDYKFLPIYDEEGKVIKRIGILTDITKDVNLEEEKEKIRLDFFANISHELRTPVNLVLSSIDVLKLKLDKLDKENYEYFSIYINIIQQNGFRLVKLINNLIDSTRIDSNSMQFQPINSDIVNFIEDTCNSVIHFVQSKNMNLTFDTNSEEAIIGFDPDFIERIMLNLLSNAIKFNKENGNIFVNIKVNEKDVTVEVSDEGFGIPEAKLKTIFDRFEQVTTKMKSQREGSGIGLYITKFLVEMHGGTIKVISELGKGSTFVFILPRKILENQQVKDISDNYSKINTMFVEFSDIYN
ncbi:PAS domain-containing sensor histidine kinase, partial [Intestinibacter sp.]